MEVGRGTSYVKGGETKALNPLLQRNRWARIVMQHPGQRLHKRKDKLKSKRMTAAKNASSFDSARNRTGGAGGGGGLEKERGMFGKNRAKEKSRLVTRLGLLCTVSVSYEEGGKISRPNSGEGSRPP